MLKSRGNARISEIAKLMNRSLSSVSEAVKRMADEGYLSYEKYGKINLTERGLKIAETVHKKLFHHCGSFTGIRDT